MQLNQQDREVLPTNVKPLRYDLVIQPDLDSLTFEGSVSIKLQVNSSSSSIQLNSVGLGINKVTLNGSTLEFALHPKKEILECFLQEANILAVGATAELFVEFSGEINDKMVGFYRSHYIEDGKSKYIAGTQFEACDARRAFPCWDEPSLKAIFGVKLLVKKGLTALSNTNVIKERNLDNGLIEYTYADTPLTSTYLIAYIIGELEFIEMKNSDGILCRVYAIKGQAQNGQFALEVAAKTLAFFTEYFDFAFPLPKLDLVALPDFSMGAMENWGLVTFRSVYLLFDKSNSSLNTKQNIAYVVGHELAHQWFGNLVTMEWWSDLWLNEGFATWVGWLAADKLFPEWEVWTEFVVDDAASGLKLDAMRSSHPIEVAVRSPSDISQIFDNISYSKGASVIRMLVAYLGEDVFRSGMRSYLKKHQYANACTADLWQSLADASGKPVASIMNSWTKQTGFPLVEVSEKSISETKKKLCFCQKRFLANGQIKQEEDHLWHVPLAVLLKEPGKEAAFMNSMMSTRDTELEVPASAEYLKLNHLQTGFYRVKYPEEYYAKLAAAVEQQALNGSDRLGVIADAFALSIHGFIPAKLPLSLLGSYSNENDYLVWGEIANQLSFMRSTWWKEPASVQLNLEKFGRNLFAKQSASLGFEFKESESDKQHQLRTLVIATSGKFQDEQIVKEALRRFHLYAAGNTAAVHPNLKSAVFAIAVRNGGTDEFDKCYEIYLNSTVADVKLAALSALGTTLDEKLIKKALSLSIDASKVRTQDIHYLFRTVGVNLKHRLIAWNFLKDNWQFFYRQFYEFNPNLLSHAFASSVQEMADESILEEIDEFFRDKEVANIQRTIDQVKEKILLSARWLKENRGNVSEFLGKFQ